MKRPPDNAAAAARFVEYDARDFTCRGTIDVVSIRIWLRHPGS